MCIYMNRHYKCGHPKADYSERMPCPNAPGCNTKDVKNLEKRLSEDCPVDGCNSTRPSTTKDSELDTTNPTRCKSLGSFE